jgi:hypothetical protein
MEVPRKDLVLDIDDTKAYSFLFLGSTRSGKTTLITWIHKHYMERKINILQTESSQAEIYKEMTRKGVLMCPGYFPKLIKECYIINRECDNKYNFNFIIDDLVGFRNDKQMTKLLTVYRNSNLGVMIGGQARSLLSATGRTNINFVFLGRLNADEQIEQVVKAYLASFFPSSMKMVDKIKKYKEITADHNWIVLDNIHDDCFITKIKI